MLLRNVNSRLLSHVAAFATALGVAAGAYWVAKTAFENVPLPLVATTGQGANYLPNLGPDWGTQNVNLVRLGNALADGTLVVLGSSELSSHDLRFVPYRLFPDELKVPTLAYGHAMFQSYGMTSVLESVVDSLSPNARLVIMVSPSWFASDGQFPRSAFAEHISGPVWDRLWSKPASRDQMRNWIEDNANFGLFWLIANGQASEFKDKLNLWWNDRGVREPDRPRNPLSVPAHRYVGWPASARVNSVTWERMFDDARMTEQELSGHNPYDVRDENYDTYLSKLPSATRDEFADGDPMLQPEVSDLSRLMALLHKKRVRAYFIMQPLHPKIVMDLERFTPVLNAFTGMCKRYQMGCLDMYSMPYESGLLRDDQHLAELGWAYADQAIAEYFSR